MPIHCAVEGGYLPLVKYFIKLGAAVSIKIKVSIVDVYIFSLFCIDIWSFVKNDRTLLHIAASQGKEDVVEYLINMNVDVNFQDKVWRLSKVFTRKTLNRN